MDVKVRLLSLTVVSLLILSVFLAFSLSSGTVTYNLNMDAADSTTAGLGGVSADVEVDNPRPTANVRLEVIRANGDKTIYEAHNVITNAGMNWTNHKTLNSAFESNADFMNYIALSTDGAAAYTDTTCPNEVASGSLGRALGTFADGGAAANGDKISYVYKNFTATAQVLSIDSACILSKSAAGVLGAIVVLPSTINMESGDKINAQWNWTRTN